jgi:hypothetical protein
VIFSGEFELSSRAVDRKTSKMNRPSSPGLLEVIRLLLQKVEGTSFPTQDPISIENLKAYLRCRIAELEVEEGLRPPPPEATERPPSPKTDDWRQAPGRRRRSPAIPAPSQESLNEDEDRSIRNRPAPRSQLSFTQ